MKTKILSAVQALIAISSLFLLSCSSIPQSDTLKAGFVNPPDSARPGVYWYFMDGNLNREAMTRDLESMKQAGIGYVLFLEVNVGIPRGKVDFLTDEWQELYKHAVSEAGRLGIRVVLGSGPGWAGSGGPWVTPAQSMTHLVASDTMVSGPGQFRATLAVPEPRRPYFGEESLTPDLKKIRDEWYEDVRVLAFPSPGKKYRISAIDDKALYYREPYTSVPGVLPFYAMPASFPEPEGAAIDKSEIVDITGDLKADGTLDWKIPAGKWTIMRFGRRNNGAVTRPAPAPGLGFEADKFDTASFNAHYDTYIGKLLRKVRPAGSQITDGWSMIHIDSWEMGAQNWSPSFREEFVRRRGYDPVPWLPVYTGKIVGSLEESERFLWDIRQTSGELIVENHAGHFRNLGRRSGFRLSVEPYDMNPAADLDLGGVADVPMCEFWSDRFGFNSAFSCFEATSIAHVRGLPVVAAEAFTADSPEAWKQYPGSVKNQGDWAFCAGINRFFYHTFAHKPLPDKYRPGMTMGPYGVHWDRGQTWWPMADAYHKYITRCQFVLSQGKAVADILYLTPEGAPQVFLPPKSAFDGTDVMPDKKSYSFDGCSPEFLIKQATVKDNCIVFPGGGKYAVLVLPEIETMTPELVKKIGDLIRSGATVIGNPPLKSPSLVNYPACDSIVNSLAADVWGDVIPADGLAVRKYGDGKLYHGRRLKDKINVYSPVKDSINLYPDYNTVATILRSEDRSPDFVSSGKYRYTHRSMTERDVYFVSNRTGSAVTDRCLFRNGSANAEIWNPVTGGAGKIAATDDENGMTAVNVKLEPYQSCFVVFFHNMAYPVEEQDLDYTDKKTVYTLEGPWKVAFDTAWGGPEKITFDELADWTKRAEEGIKYYSGSAVYTKTFDFHDFQSGSKTEYWLDPGRIRNLCSIRLNGKDLGVLWTDPWRVNITKCLRQTGNELEITVTNLWINRLIGDETQPWDGIEGDRWPDWLLNGTNRPSGRYTFTTHRFYNAGDPLSESGLEGPVTIKTIY